MNPFRRNDREFERALSDSEYRVEYVRNISWARKMNEMIGYLFLLCYLANFIFAERPFSSAGIAVCFSAGIFFYLMAMRCERDVRLLMVHAANGETGIAKQPLLAD